MTTRGEVCLLLVVFWMLPTAAWAQGSCVIPIRTVTEIKGRVVTERFGVPQAKVLLKDRKDRIVLKRRITDDEGNFDFGNLSKGKYFLLVSRDLFSPLRIPISLELRNNDDNKTLLVHLAPDYRDACSEGGVEIVAERPAI